MIGDVQGRLLTPAARNTTFCTWTSDTPGLVSFSFPFMVEDFFLKKMISDLNDHDLANHRRICYCNLNVDAVSG